MKGILILFCLVIIITSCKKSESPTVTPQSTGFVSGHGAFIVNEGKFQENNASISYLNLDSVVVHNNIFSNANNGISLGDVAQSITVDENRAYIVLNNSQKIECVSSNTFKFISSIDGFVSPSALLSISSTKAYVTDSFADKVYIVNTQNNSISGSINVGEPTGSMLQSGNKVYVASPGTYSIYVINSDSDALVDSIPVANGPSSMSIDKNGMLWVYCAGNYPNSIHPALYEVNTKSNSVVNELSFTSVYTSEGSLCMNAAKDSLYFIHRDVYAMSINDKQLPFNTFISSGGENLNGLLKTPDGRILITENKNSFQDGNIFIYNANGTLIKSIEVGINPGEIVFY